MWQGGRDTQCVGQGTHSGTSLVCLTEQSGVNLGKQVSRDSGRGFWGPGLYAFIC